MPNLSSVRNLTSDKSGSIAITFAIGLPILVLCAGACIDYGMAFHQRQTLQAAVDSAALAGAKVLSMQGFKGGDGSELAKSTVQSLVQTNLKQSSLNRPVLKVSFQSDPTAVSVHAALNTKLAFGNVLGLNLKKIEVASTARIVGQPNICVLGLDGSASGTVQLDQRSRLEGDNCAVFSNSTSTSGIKANEQAFLKATTICSAGGAQGGKTNFDVPPFQDCPNFEDPLAALAEPEVGGCDYGQEGASPHYTSNTETLSAGVFW